VTWTENLIVLAVLVLLSPLIERMSLKVRRRTARRRCPGGFEAHLRVMEGSVPYVPSVGMSGIAAIEAGRLSFAETRVRGLEVDEANGESRRIRGRAMWSMYPFEVIVPIRLRTGATVELALTKADEEAVLSALGLARGNV